MHIIELIADRPLVWGIFLVYMAATAWLAWLGHRKTADIRSFAIGRGDMNPFVVGITLAASIASTATFIINPGFVYVHGISALLHLGLAAGVGITLGLVVMSVGFRTIGARTKAITLPHWIGQRYGSRPLAAFFAALNLLSITFLVLITGGLSIMMQQTMGLSNVESLALIIGFVFAYIFVGGTYAHAYTNTIQGFLMIVASAVIVGSGFHLLAGGVGPFLDRVGAGAPQLLLAVNPESSLFGSFFSVFVSGFVIGFALVCQPHIMTKALYVKSTRDVWKYLGVTFVVSLFFTALLLVGLYARALGMAPAAFTDPATGVFRQDLVVAGYLGTAFGPLMLAFISVAILSAGMSTLDGILVALSSIAANDLFLPLASRRLHARPEEERLRIAHRASQVILVAIGIVVFVIALHPPRLLGIFGQIGVYGIVAAATVPILFGILSQSFNGRMAGAAAAIGLSVHFLLYASGSWATAAGYDLAQLVDGTLLALIADTRAPQLGLGNPAVTATYAIFASAAGGLLSIALVRFRRPAPLPVTEKP